ncbi:MAG: restriction endonuclease [Candidatus Paceibacterota bacterium]|jgi:restriction system protein
MAIPTYDNLFNPVIKALHELGGSGSIAEIEEKVANLLKLSEDEINEIHRGNRTKLGYRLAWSRNYLKRFGVLENSSRGVWALTTKGREVNSVDKNIVNHFVKTIDRETDSIEAEVAEGTEPEGAPKLWEEELLEQCLQLSPEAFERLCQRILRESGFVQVEVTGRSGDGGIDGRGIIKIGGLLSFRIIFQCKRYAGSVSSQQIRDFRGAMVGRADKGLVITTGTFTRDAKQEATRDGAPPIDLIEGDELVEKMKELKIGINLKTEEVVEVNKEWFINF